MAKTEKKPAGILVSYSGSVSATVDFGVLRFQRHQRWEKEARKAARQKKEKPAKPTGIRDGALFLKAGSTAEVSQTELDYLETARADIFRFINVHKGAPTKPRSVRAAEEKKAAKADKGDGKGGGKKTRKVKPK